MQAVREQAHSELSPSNVLTVRVKICGVANAADAVALAALRPDAIGFVFWPRSPRAAQPEAVAEWTRGWPTGLLKVGVFVDAAPDEVRRTAELAGLDVIQWHNDRLPPPPIPAGCRLWQVARIKSSFDGGCSSDSHPAIDALLLDSYSASLPGGTGQPLDWAAARQFVTQRSLPVLLAGGLTPGGPYVSMPIVAGLLKSGASTGTMVAFLTSWSLWAVSRLPLEIGILGWQFMFIRLGSTFIFPPIAGIIANVITRFVSTL